MPQGGEREIDATPDEAPRKPPPGAAELARRLDDAMRRLDAFEAAALAREPGLAPRLVLGEAPDLARRRPQKPIPAPPSSSDLPERALAPAGAAAIRLGGVAAKGAMLLNCLGLAAGEVKAIWRAWPRRTLEAGISPVFIVDAPHHSALWREGVTIEMIASRTRGGAGWERHRQEQLEFIRLKYGASRIADGRTFLRGA